MAVISLLVIEPHRLPSFEAVKTEVEGAGDAIELVCPIDLRTHTGYLPVRVHGRDTGFEYYFDPIPNGALPPEVTIFGSHHIVARTGSDFGEGRAALIFLKVVARMSGGAYVYPDDGIIVAPENVSSYLQGEIEAFAKHIK